MLHNEMLRDGQKVKNTEKNDLTLSSECGETTVLTLLQICLCNVLQRTLSTEVSRLTQRFH